MNISFSQSMLYKTLINSRALFTYINIEHNETIGFWSNELTKIREKIKP